MRKRPMFLGVLVLALAVVLAACGGGESPTPTPGAAATATPAAGPGSQATPTPAAATWRPSRAVTFLVGFAPGGGHDITARVLAPALSQELGVPVVVRNLPGASEYIMRSQLVNSRADGHTFAITHVTNGLIDDVVELQDKPYGTMEDFDHIGRLTFSPVTLVAGRHLNVTRFEELREVPTLISDLVSVGNVLRDIVYGGALGYPRDNWEFRTIGGTGSLNSIQQAASGERDVYNMDTPAGNNLILGDRNPIPLLHFDTEPHPLASEDPIFDIPTVVELGHPELVAFGLHRGLMAPKGLPPEVTATLVDVFERVMARTDIQEQLIAIGLEPGWLAGPEWDQMRHEMVQASLEYKDEVLAAVGR